ncbi:MAG: response regulator transcription factor [Kouleothrix sp.]
MRILVIEDDRRLARLMTRVLEEEHMSVDQTDDGESGLELALRGTYDVAIIDWMLPGRDGPAICRAVRAAPARRAADAHRAQPDRRSRGRARQRRRRLPRQAVCLRRAARARPGAWPALHPAAADPWELRGRDLVLDLRACTVRRGQHTIDLTVTEWNPLECLMRHPNQVLNRQQILDYVWSYERDVQASMVDVYISYLRRKLHVDGHPDPIQTVRGVGYRLEAGDV